MYKLFGALEEAEWYKGRDKCALNIYLFPVSRDNNAVKKEEKSVYKFSELTKKDNYLKNDLT